MPVLPTDSRSSVDRALLEDARVTQLWDEGRVVGRWLAQSGVGERGSGFVWDAYYLFGPDAEWNERPGPLVGFGAPVVSETGSLDAELRPLL